MIDLKNKNVLVTGAARGIGKAIAIAFAKEGCNIIVNYKNSEKEAISTCEEIRKLGVKAFAIKADVSFEVQVNDMFDNIKGALGNIDILVNNAGIVIPSVFRKMSIEDFDMVMKTNLYSAVFCSKKALSGMREKRDGVIINMSSSSSEHAYYGQTGYSCSKAAINALTKSLALENGKYNIRINAIAPGLITTDMTKDLKEDIRQDFLNKTALGKMGKTEDISEMAVFLAKSEFITGQIMNINGGIYI